MGSSDLLTRNEDQPNVFRKWTGPSTAGELITINVVDSGTETDNAKFFDKGFQGTGYTIVANQDFEITSIKRGDVELLLGDAIPVAVSTRRTRIFKQPLFSIMVLRATVANTVFQLEVF